MSTKAVLETSPALRDRTKKAAIKQGLSTKRLTTALMTKGLDELESGTVEILDEPKVVSVNQTEGGK